MGIDATRLLKVLLAMRICSSGDLRLGLLRGTCLWEFTSVAYFGIGTQGGLVICDMVIICAQI